MKKTHKFEIIIETDKKLTDEQIENIREKIDDAVEEAIDPMNDIFKEELSIQTKGGKIFDKLCKKQRTEKPFIPTKKEIARAKKDKEEEKCEKLGYDGKPKIHKARQIFKRMQR